MKKLIWLGTLVSVVGCDLVLGIDRYRTAKPVTPPECTTHSECTKRATAQGPLNDAGFDAGTLDGGIVPAVCVKPENKCVRLLSEDCTSLTGDVTDDSILLATLFSLKGSQGATNLPRQRSATLAAEEINSALGGRGIPSPDGGTPRPLLVLSCDESTNLTRVGEHLVNELHVAALVGPNTSQDTLDLTTQLSAAGGTLLMSPSAIANSIASLNDNKLTWRVIPSDAQRNKLLVSQIGEVEAMLHPMRGPQLKLALVYRDDAMGQSTFGSLSEELTVNGKPISDAMNGAFVTIRPYGPTSEASQKEVADALIAFKPDIVGLFGTAESVTKVLVPLEQGLTQAQAAARPYYVLIDSNKTKELLAALTTLNVGPDLRSRIRGTGVTPEGMSNSVFGSFKVAYQSRYPDVAGYPSVASMGPSYDAMYALGYALAATNTEPPSGASIAKGLAKLGTGPVIEVGRNNVLAAFQKLAKGESITPRGTFSVLKWDNNGDIAGGSIEMWCIGLAKTGNDGGTPFYQSSGLTLDVRTQQTSGTYKQCE